MKSLNFLQSCLRHRLVLAVLALTAFSGSPVCAEPSPETIRISVDPRIELISIVFHLAGNREYNQCVVKSYNEDIRTHFAGVTSHSVVEFARQLNKDHGIHLNAPMSVAPYIDTDFQFRKSLDEWPWEVDSRWRKEDLQTFVDDLRDFADTSQFATFFEAHQDLYRTTVERMRELTNRYSLEKWINGFFGSDGETQLNLVVSLINGPNNYATRYQDGCGSEYYSIIGITSCDDSGLPVIGKDKMHIVAHEFSHSYANPIVEKNLDKLQSAGERIYPLVSKALERQAYGSWTSMMYESVTRACEASFLKTCVGEESHKDFIEREKQKGAFIWIEHMARLAQTYEESRDRYPTFESYFPEFIEFFNTYKHSPYDFPIAVSYAKPKTVCEDTTIDIGIDPRIELISIVFRLAGNGEYGECNVPAYDKIVEEYFAPYENHQAIQFAREIEDTSGIHMDAPISMALQLDERFQPRKAFSDWPWGIDKRWSQGDAQTFLAHLEDFVRDTQFEKFIESNKDLYDSIVRPHVEFMGRRELETWFYDFFGSYPDAKIHLVVSPLTGLNFYRGAYESGAKKERYFLIGVAGVDPQGVPTIHERWVGKIFEELSSAYLHPIVANHIREIRVNDQSKRHVHLLAGTWNDRVLQYAKIACLSYYVKGHFEDEVHRDFQDFHLNRGFVDLDKATELIARCTESRGGFNAYFDEFCKFLDGRSSS